MASSNGRRNGLTLASISAAEPDLAPQGVDYDGSTSHDRERITLASHPYITGIGYGGSPLLAQEFDNWNTTDSGTLADVPAGALIVLRNDDGPSLIEYEHGAGRVIATTLNFCTSDLPSDASRQQPLRNLLRYAPFFNGLAQTPGLTATPTPTPTATETGLATETPTITPTMPTATPTPSPTFTDTPTPPPPTSTPTPEAGNCPGDCDGGGTVTINELIRAVAIALGQQPLESCPAADTNRDGRVSINELIAAVQASLNGCPA